MLQPKSKPIHAVLQQFGSFTAHRIIDILEAQKSGFLGKLAELHRDRHSQYSVWQDIQAANIFSEKVAQQKMEYIHANPVNKRWHLVENRADYLYSSARFYDRGESPIIEIDDIRDLFI